ncbi:TetR/AcrR family transcriptional regulator [Paracoccaceae bacterium Fryx2]|nr:TetR/AcrR family transcriptional regulator [Paracoccaceae bacterium Fryx2]
MPLQTGSALLFAPSADLRGAEILGRVRTAFLQKGFDGASMQDLALAAGMSVGNFYRYFPSKAAIVQALVARDLAEVERDFSLVLGADDPLAALRRTLSERLEGDTAHCSPDDRPLWAEITAAAARKPEIGAALAHMESVIVTYLTRLFGHLTGIAPAEADRRFDAQARLILLLIKAAVMQMPDPARDQGALNDLILQTVDRTIEDILTHRTGA